MDYAREGRNIFSKEIVHDYEFLRLPEVSRSNIANKIDHVRCLLISQIYKQAVFYMSISYRLDSRNV